MEADEPATTAEQGRISAELGIHVATLLRYFCYEFVAEAAVLP
jgi:hypothetical protein